MDAFSNQLAEELDTIRSQGLFRSLREVGSPQGNRILLDGRKVVNFSSNDYLGLANEDFLREAMVRGVRDFGVGAGASRLISGNQSPVARLEKTIAAWKNTDACVVFANGYATATGTIPALVGKEDVVILDKLSHACLVDGARLSGATIRVFPHNHTEKLESHLRWARESRPAARVLILTESVFSMDGDLAPLETIIELKDRFGAVLVLDEAHATGVLGPEGRGAAHALGLAHRVEIQMGTLGKALGTSGGFVCGGRHLAHLLVNRARSLIFSTCPPAAVSEAAREAVLWLQTQAGRERLAALKENIQFANEAFAELAAQSQTAIFPVLIGEEQIAVEVANQLLAHGFYAPAIRFPTVPKGKSRLRASISARNSKKQIDDFAECLAATLHSNRNA